MTMPRPQVLRRRVFFGAMAALALLVASVTAQFVLHERQQVIDENFATAALHARAFEEHLTQSFNVIDLTLAHAAEIDPAEIAAAGSSPAFTADLRRAPYLHSLALLDADGSIVASSNLRNLGRKVALAGFLPPAPDATEVLRVGPPWSGRDFAEGRPSTSGPAANADAPGFLPVTRDVVLHDGCRVTMLAAIKSAGPIFTCCSNVSSPHSSAARSITDRKTACACAATAAHSRRRFSFASSRLPRVG